MENNSSPTRMQICFWTLSRLKSEDWVYMPVVLHFRPDLDLVNVEDCRRSQVQVIDHFYSIFSDGLYVCST